MEKDLNYSQFFNLTRNFSNVRMLESQFHKLSQVFFSVVGSRKRQSYTVYRCRHSSSWKTGCQCTIRVAWYDDTTVLVAKQSTESHNHEIKEIGGSDHVAACAAIINVHGHVRMPKSLFEAISKYTYPDKIIRRATYYRCYNRDVTTCRCTIRFFRIMAIWFL